MYGVQKGDSLSRATSNPAVPLTRSCIYKMAGGQITLITDFTLPGNLLNKRHISKMFTPRSDDVTLLRNTCDRCRELKVRCAKAENSPTTTRTPQSFSFPPCIRCIRAGTACLFSPKQPSGRPVARPESRRDMTVEKSNSDAQLPAVDLFADNFLMNDELLSEMIDTGPATYGSMLDSMQSPEYDMAGPGAQRFLDPTEKMVRDISDLNLRIYLATRPASTQQVTDAASDAGCTTPSSNELIDLTKGVIDVGDRVTKPRPATERGPMLPYGTASPGDMLISLPTRPWSSGALVDTSAILMVLACHDRLLELFCLVCSSLQVQETRRLETPADTESCSMLASAQTVMTVELVNHLLERLERSQKQLCGAMSSSGCQTAVVAGAPGRGQINVEKEGGQQQGQLPAPTGQDYDNVSGDATVCLLREKQAWVRNCINIIKSIINK
ncbi:hypothetical protein F4778DRAFT_342269 [Xylariomycetidae sp. FL2044]|nr:hypothetical protein F4778DRAFT_342269 [Xylariomycetidae sp. FL2044]